MAGKSAGSIFVDLLLNDAKFREGVNRSRSQTNKLSKDLIAFGKVGAVAIGAVSVALVALTVKQAHAIDETIKMSRTLGIASKEFYNLALVAEEAGVSQEKLGSLINKGQKAIAEAAEGGSAAFRRLGLDAKALLALTPDKQFEKIAAALGKIQNPAIRNTLAMQVFGKSGIEVNKMLQDMSAKLEDARKFNEKFGLAVSDIDASKIEAMNDALGRVGKAALGVGNTIAIQVAPIVKGLADEFLNILPSADEFTRYVTASIDGLAFLLDRLAISIRQIKFAFGEGIPSIGAAWWAKMMGEDDVSAIIAQNFTESLDAEKKALGADFNKVQDWIKEQRAKTNAEAAKAVQDAKKFGVGINFDPDNLEALKDTSWMAGVREGLRQINDEFNDFAKLSQNLVTDTFHNLEDAFVDLAKTGKFEVKGMVDAILNDLIRLQVRKSITKPLFDAASSFLPQLFGSFAGGFATGGTIPSGKWGIVGEKGPELAFGGSVGQTIIPQMGGGAGGVIVNVINNTGSSVSTRQGTNGASLDVVIDEAVARGISKRGTATNRALSGYNNMGLTRR